ncbi:MAG: GLPGLI family protein [Prevotella sp.]|nr:GLPGLI family protein [Prevotella sp.]
MKRLLYIILYIALAATASAQEAIDTAQFVAVYDYECRTQDAEGTPVTDRMQLAVQVGRTVTKSMPLSAYQRTDEITSAEAAIEFQEAMLHMPTVWTGYPEGQTTVREFVFPHDYEGYESTPDFVWTLTNDTLTVSGYYCQTATCKFRGVAWTVCYTEEIPSSAGSWRLRGLPGLIVKAESEAHTFCLTELRKEASSITAPEHRPDVQRMKYAKLLKHRNEIYGNRQYAKNPTYYVPDLGGSINNMDVLNHDGQQLVFANGHPLLTEAHVYQPLELK